MQFEAVRLIQTDRSPIPLTPAENKVKESKGRHSHAFRKLQKLFKHIMLTAQFFRQAGFLGCWTF